MACWKTHSQSAGSDADPVSTRQEILLDKKGARHPSYVLSLKL